MNDLHINSHYIICSTTDLNYSSKSNTTNTSLSSNSLHFDEEDEGYSPSKETIISPFDKDNHRGEDSFAVLREPATSSCANSINNE